MALTEDQLKKAARKAYAAGDVKSAQELFEQAQMVKGIGADGSVGPDGMTAGQRAKAARDGTLAPPSAERLAGQAAIDQSAEDRMTIEAQPGGMASISKVMQGIPFVGEYFDEGVGALGNALRGPAVGNRAMEDTRALQGAMDREYPKTSMGLQIGGGIAGSIPLAIAAGPTALANAPATLLGKGLAAGGIGAVAGGIEGAVSGYGVQGDRLENAKDRGLLGAAFGGALGAAAPALGAGVKALAERVKGMDVKTIARTLGISDDAARALKPDLEALDFGAAEAALKTAGPKAMLADAGITTREALDAAITGGGKAAQTGVKAVSERAAEAGSRLGKVMDLILGVPEGVKKVGKSIAVRTAPARDKAYKMAYGTAIDYADNAGRNIEGVLARVDPPTLKAAITEANDAMRAAGVSNKQIMAEISDAGEVVFKEMPNVQQLDELKKGLDAIARAETDEITGKISSKGRRAKLLAADLRTAIADAVPAYKTAVKLGGDKIATENALNMGRKIFGTGYTRETVAEVMDGASVEAKDAARQGIREYIDDTLARVRRSVDDPNVDTAETLRLLNTLSSRDARAKLGLVLGDAKADRLLAEIDAAGKQFGTRQAIATGSATGRREARSRALDDQLAPGMIGNAAKGKPVEGLKSFIQLVTRATPQAELARKQEVLADVARALTELRGPQAEAALKLIEKAVSGQPLKNEEALRIARLVSTTGALGGYQTGQKYLASPELAPLPR